MYIYIYMYMILYTYIYIHIYRLRHDRLSPYGILPSIPVESRFGLMRDFGVTPGELLTISKPNPYPKSDKHPARKVFKNQISEIPSVDSTGNSCRPRLAACGLRP